MAIARSPFVIKSMIVMPMAIQKRINPIIRFMMFCFLSGKYYVLSISKLHKIRYTIQQ